MNNETLNIKLLVSSNNLKLSEVADFKVGLNFTNNSNSLFHFDISETALYVNNKKSVAWDLAVQNGTIINLKIQPRKSKTVQWPLGNALFEETGKYTLELRWGEKTEIQEVTITN